MRKTEEIQTDIERIDGEIAEKMKKLQRLKVELAYSFMHLPLPDGSAPVLAPHSVLNMGVLNEK